MTPLKVSFHLLDFDPAEIVDRTHYGIIPPEWVRHRFLSDAGIRVINRWLHNNIEGRWAIYADRFKRERTITIAFELGCDAALFVLADGQNQCLELESEF